VHKFGESVAAKAKTFSNENFFALISTLAVDAVTTSGQQYSNAERFKVIAQEFENALKWMPQDTYWREEIFVHISAHNTWPSKFYSDTFFSGLCLILLSMEMHMVFFIIFAEQYLSLNT
jgi:hypothetical protein